MASSATLETQSTTELSKSQNLNINLEFFGGLDVLFSKKKFHQISLPLHSGTEWSIKHLLFWIRDNLLMERQELFLQDDTVRPGILVVINDIDWELKGCQDYIIQQNDKISFISTLHGG